MTRKTRGRAQPEKAVGKGRGLVLDDLLVAIDDLRKTYHLREAKFGLEQIEREAGAKSAIQRIIDRTLARYGTAIYSKPHPLFNRLGHIRWGKRMNIPRLYSGRRIPPAHAPQVLRLVLERALQTIVQLPAKAPRWEDGSRELKQLASHYDALAKEIQHVLGMRAVCSRASVYFKEGPGLGLTPFVRQAEELQRTAEILRAILTRTRLVKPRMDSPNPQVGFAMYLIAWFEASTGQKQYGPFKTLLGAAYAVNAIDAPPWVDRLAIEMTRHRARRKTWARSTIF